MTAFADSNSLGRAVKSLPDRKQKRRSQQAHCRSGPRKTDRPTLQFQLARQMPDVAGNPCTAPLNSACGVSPRAGGTSGLARIPGHAPPPAEGPYPASNGVGVTAQGLRCTRGSAHSGQEPDGTPAFPPPWRQRQAHPPKHIIFIQPPPLQKPDYPPQLANADKHPGHRQPKKHSQPH